MNEIEFLDHLKYEVERLLGYNVVCGIRVRRELIDKRLDYFGNPSTLTLENVIDWFDNNLVKSVVLQIAERLKELRDE